MSFSDSATPKVLQDGYSLQARENDGVLSAACTAGAEKETRHRVRMVMHDSIRFIRFMDDSFFYLVEFNLIL
jgi:hypothetical protein